MKSTLCKSDIRGHFQTSWHN